MTQKQKTKAVVLLSGGQDSTTCLYWARAQFDEVHALSMFYGQVNDSELAAAEEIGQLAGVTSHTVLNIASPFATLTDSALLQHSGTEISPVGGAEDSETGGPLPSTYVPARNLIFLTHAAQLAFRLGASNLVTGVTLTDYSVYPDCRPVFIEAAQAAINAALPSGAPPMVIHTPLMYLTKTAEVQLARTLPGCWDALAKTVTCYHGKRPGCGECRACELRAIGFAEAGEQDPAMQGDTKN